MLEEKVLKELKTIAKHDDKIVIGVSGGPDSMCLLNILYKLKYNVVAVHVNHLIRKEAVEDECYVKDFCNNLNIPVYIKRIDITKKANNEKIGLEEAGRIARYEFFEEVLIKENAQKIATAHNKNDFAETIIMNILRGSGINGIKSIEKNRNNKYIKPLITTERKEIENYCEENNLNPRIDATNSDNTYTRNKIRNIVIPYIKKEFNPNIIQTLTRMSDIVSADLDYIENQTKNIYSNILIIENSDNIILKLKDFNNLDLAIKRRIIIYSIEKLCNTKKGIEKIHIDDIIKLCSNNIGNKYLTPNKNVKVAIKNKQIYILKTNCRYDILENIGG